MASTLAYMGKKKPSNPDRPKRKPVQLRLHHLIHQQLKALAELNASDMTTEISIAVRERLERHNLWPPGTATE